MTRFLQSFAAGLLAVLLIGGGVVALSSTGDGTDAAASAQLLGQTDDGATEGPSADGGVVVALAPIEQLLAQLRPTGEGTALQGSQRVLLSRDPFAPVVPEAASDGGTTDGGTDGGTTDGGTDGGTTDGGTDGGTTDGGTADGGTSNGDDESACTGSETETVCDGVVVTLDSVAGGVAMVTVDGTTYEVAVGDDFATSFRVLAVNAPCVTLLYGDETFSICEGATVLK